MTEENAEAGLFIRLKAFGASETKRTVSQIRSQFANLSKDMQNVRAQAAGVRGALGQLGGSARRIAIAGGVVGGGAAAAAAGITSIANAASDGIVESKKFADQVGLSFDSYQTLQLLAKKTGFEVDGLNGFLINLADKATDAFKGNTTAADDLASVGVSAVDATGQLKPLLQIYLEMADAIAAMPDGTEKTGALSILAGDDGARSIPMLNLGGDGIMSAMERFEREGALRSDEDVKLALESLQARQALIDQLERIVGDLSLILAPDIATNSNALAERLALSREQLELLVRSEWAKAKQQIDGLWQSLRGDDGARSWIADAESDLRDLYTALSGGDGDIKNDGIANVRSDFEAFATDVENAWNRILGPVFGEIKSAIDLIISGINEVFGTDFTAREIGIAAVALKVTGILSGIVQTLRATVGLISSVGPVITSIAGAVGALLANPIVLTAIAAAGATAAGIKGIGALDSLGLLGSISNEQIRADLSAVAAEAEGIAAVEGKAAGEAYIAAYLSALEIAGVRASRLSGAWSFLERRGFDRFSNEALIAQSSARLARRFDDRGVGFDSETRRAVLSRGFEGLVDRGSTIDRARVFGAELKAVVSEQAGAALDALVDQLTIDMSSIETPFADAATRGLESVDPDLVRLRTSIERAAASALSAALGGESDVPLPPSVIARRSSGGLVVGAGSGTSDSIVARVSNGEYVVRAAAVRRFGAGFFDAINAGILPGFASGGLVGAIPSPAARLSTEGVSGGSSRPVILQLPDGSSAPMRGDADVVAALEKKLRRSAVAQAVRKPGWYK